MDTCHDTGVCPPTPTSRPCDGSRPVPAQVWHGWCPQCTLRRIGFRQLPPMRRITTILCEPQTYLTAYTTSTSSAKLLSRLSARTAARCSALPQRMQRSAAFDAFIQNQTGDTPSKRRNCRAAVGLSAVAALSRTSKREPGFDLTLPATCRVRLTPALDSCDAFAAVLLCCTDCGLGFMRMRKLRFPAMSHLTRQVPLRVVLHRPSMRSTRWSPHPMVCRSRSLG